MVRGEVVLTPVQVRLLRQAAKGELTYHERDDAKHGFMITRYAPAQQSSGRKLTARCTDSAIPLLRLEFIAVGPVVLDTAPVHITAAGIRWLLRTGYTRKGDDKK